MNQSPTPQPAQAAPGLQRLAYFPITFFPAVMGLMGLVLAIQASAPFLAWPGAFLSVVLWFSILVMVIISVIYVAKMMLHPAAVRAEWSHPVKLAFFPAISISLLLTATAIIETYPGAAYAIWLLGTAGQGVLSVAVVSAWMSSRSFEVGHLTPAWFIPAVGNVIVPLAGVRLGYVEISWLFFSAGLMFWVVLLSLVMHRLMFHTPIPAPLLPSMAILIAPPAVGFIAYYQLSGQIDAFAHILLNVAYVFAVLVLIQLPKILRLPFSLSWWALSFPVAALSVASFLYASLIPVPYAHMIIGFVALVALLIIIFGLLFRTGLAIARGQICRPEQGPAVRKQG